MVKAGYPKRFGAGVITVAGSLGILMLPSIPKVIYAVSTNTSIGALFVAGLVPGIAAHHHARAPSPGIARGATHYPRMPKARWPRARARVPRKHLGPDAGRHHHRRHLSGLFTPTEAAAMSAVYAFFVAVYVYKDLKLKTCRACCCARPT